MMSSTVDAVLLCALLVTTISVVLMYRKLKQLDKYHADYQRIFVETAAALHSAREAVRAFHDEGRETVVELAREIEEAQRLIADLDARRPGGAGDAAARTNEAPR